MSRCNVGAMGTGGAAVVGCNDLWNNPNGDYAGTIIPGTDDIHADPLYCDDLVDDYRLSTGSPALNPPGCGRMGAFGQGCGATATENMTWGAVKERFR